MVKNLMMSILLVSSQAIAVSSFKQLSATKLNDKCDSNKAILVLAFNIQGICESLDGQCSDRLSLDLAPTSFSCGSQDPMPSYVVDSAKAYFAGWQVKAVNWGGAPDKWTQQVSNLAFGLNNQVVNGANLELDFQVSAAAATPNSAFRPERRQVSARIEVFAVNPKFINYISLESEVTQVQAQGTAAIGSGSHPERGACAGGPT
jgi:hypothetical protein